MQEFTLRFSRTYQIILAIATACLLIIPLVFFTGIYISGLAEGPALGFIFSVLALISILVFFLIRLMLHKVTVTILPNGLAFTFLRPNIFTPQNFRLAFSDILSGNVGEGEAGSYISLRCKHSPRRFNLQAASLKRVDEETFVQFASALAAAWQKSRS